MAFSPFPRVLVTGWRFLFSLVLSFTPSSISQCIPDHQGVVVVVMIVVVCVFARCGCVRLFSVLWVGGMR